MEEMYSVRNTTIHPVHLTYKDEKGMPQHITLEPGKTGALPRTQMLTAVLNPFVEHKGEVVAADERCQAEVDKMLPGVKIVKETIKNDEKKTEIRKPGREK